MAPPRSRTTGGRLYRSSRVREVTVDVNSADFIKGLEKAAEAYVATSHEGLGRDTHRVRNKAAAYARVDLGDMKSGWQVVEGRDAFGPYWEVKNHVGHTAENEFGTEHMSPNPQLRPAIAEVLGIQGVGAKIERKTT